MTLPCQRISLVTLGVDNLDRARAFYAALGWAEAESTDGMACFQLHGQALMLFGRADLCQGPRPGRGRIGHRGRDAGAVFRNPR